MRRCSATQQMKSESKGENGLSGSPGKWPLNGTVCVCVCDGMCLVSSRGGRRRRRYKAASAAVSSSKTSSDVVPAELTGSVKWTTVKIADSTQPTTDSIFLGANQVCPSLGLLLTFYCCTNICLKLVEPMLYCCCLNSNPNLLPMSLGSFVFDPVTVTFDLSPQTIPFLGYPKVIPYTKFEHFGIFRF